MGRKEERAGGEKQEPERNLVVKTALDDTAWSKIN